MIAGFSSRRKDLACMLVLIALAVLFMGESLLPDRMLAPLDIVMRLRPWSVSEYAVSDVYNGLPSDKVLYIHPVKVLVGEAWRAGLPLWEPRMLSGYPIVGNAQAGIFYPGTLPYVFLPSTDASDLVALIHLAAAGLGMFGYLRSLRLRRAASLLGAIVFMFNTGFMTWLMWDSVAGAMVWLPWALWAFEAALCSGRIWIATLGAVALALAYLGGHLLWSLYAVLILALYSGYRFIVTRGVSRQRVIVVASIMLIGGTASAAIQLLPSLEYISFGHRGPLSFPITLDWSSFLMLWAPRFFGGGYLLPGWWGPVNYNESIIFVGIIPLVLALTAIVGRRDVHVIFWGLLGLFALFCAAGTDVHRVLTWLPGFNSLGPVRMRYIVVVCLAILSALGLEWLLGVKAGARWHALGSILIASTSIGVAYTIFRVPQLPLQPNRLSYVRAQESDFVLWLLLAVAVLSAGVLSRRWGALILTSACVLTLIQLWPLGAAYQRPISTQYYYPLTPSIATMTQDKDFFRVLTTRRDWSNWPFKPNLPALYDLQDVGGYDSQYLRRYVDFVKAIDRTGPAEPESNFLSPANFTSPLVDLLNVKYAVTLDKVKADGWQLITKEGMRVYQRTHPLPRVWLVPQAEVIRNDGAILARLSEPDFDPRQTVVLEQDPSESLGTSESESVGTVSIESYANTHLTLNAVLEHAGWLVLSEIFYPGWHVTVDGASADMYRANYIFRAVPLPVGAHHIEMVFMPDSFAVGAGIMIVAALTLLTLGVGLWCRERRQQQHQPA